MDNFNNQFATRRLLENQDYAAPKKDDRDSEYQAYKEKHIARRQTTQDKVDRLKWNRDLMRGEKMEETSATGGGASMAAGTGEQAQLAVDVEAADADDGGGGRIHHAILESHAPTPAASARSRYMRHSGTPSGAGPCPLISSFGASPAR